MTASEGRHQQKPQARHAQKESSKQVSERAREESRDQSIVAIYRLKKGQWATKNGEKGQNIL